MRSALMLLCLLSSSWVHADSRCLSLLIDADGDTVEQALMSLSTPDCDDRREQALQQLEQWLMTSPSIDPQADAEDIGHLNLERSEIALTVAAVRVRMALDAGNISEARTRLATVDALHAADPRLAPSAWRRPILDVLDGQAAPPLVADMDAGEDWILQYSNCGDPVAAVLFAAQTQPTVADAWRALGRADLAIAQLLQDEWVDAIGMGLLPPQLRFHARAWLGDEGWRREIERALRGLRFERGVNGTRITLPLLGHSLPLPVGHKGPTDERPTLFANATEAADYYRRRFFPDAEKR